MVFHAFPNDSPMDASTRKNWLIAGCLVLFGIGSVGLLVASVQRISHSLILKQTRNDLKWIAMALEQYHEEYGSYPPVLVRDESGKPMHSWRGLIQPHLARVVQAKDDFSGYNFTQPWDSRHNQEAARDHRFGNHEYQFLAVVGPEAAWDSNTPRSREDFREGATSRTILIAAVRDSGISWNEPRDLKFNGSELLLDGRSYSLPEDTFFLMTDGSIVEVSPLIPPEVLRAALTRAADEQVMDW